MALLLLGTLFFTLSCVENQPMVDPPISDPESQVYYESYDEVWRGVQLALRKYPVHLNNIESGILETEYIKADKIFVEPGENQVKPGQRYKLTVRAIKGEVSGDPAIKIICIKTVEVQPDFFTGYQPRPSDGLEEKAILYRIGRYLDMERLLNRNN